MAHIAHTTPRGSEARGPRPPVPQHTTLRLRPLQAPAGTSSHAGASRPPRRDSSPSEGISRSPLARDALGGEVHRSSPCTGSPISASEPSLIEAARDCRRRRRADTPCPPPAREPQRSKSFVPPVLAAGLGTFTLPVALGSVPLLPCLCRPPSSLVARLVEGSLLSPREGIRQW